jgi:hypothetical protein
MDRIPSHRSDVDSNNTIQIFLDTFVCQANTNNTNYFFFEVLLPPTLFSDRRSLSSPLLVYGRNLEGMNSFVFLRRRSLTSNTSTGYRIRWCRGLVGPVRPKVSGNLHINLPLQLTPT